MCSCMNNLERAASRSQGELERLGDVDEQVDDKTAFRQKKTHQPLTHSVRFVPASTEYPPSFARVAP